MKMTNCGRGYVLVLSGWILSFWPSWAGATVTTYFNAAQVATLVSTGMTSDTISSEGYVFTYTRDKLFTGGVGLTNPIGRYVRVPWPEGVEAQAVTTGPVLSGARITIRREDGEVFSLKSFSARLLANTAGAGGAIEIMPKLQGEDALNDPLYFSASGYYGSEFSYDTGPNYLGSTAGLTNYEAYVITLYVDYALTALSLESTAPPVNHPPVDIQLSSATILENEPAGTWIGTLSTIDQDSGDTFAYALVDGPGGADNVLFYLVEADLFSAGAFNYEAKSNYTIRAESTDLALASTQKVFVVQVQDVSEPPPDCAMLPEFPDGGVVLSWASIANHTYSLHASTNIPEGFQLVTAGIPATPPLNTYTSAALPHASCAWMISTEP